MNKMKITPKRTSRSQKIWYIMKPFLVYMLVKTSAMLILAIIIPALPISGIDAWVESAQHQLSAVINAVSSLIAVRFLLYDFLKEVAVSGEVDIDAGVIRQFLAFLKKGFWGYEKIESVGLICCAVLGAISAYVLNGVAAICFRLFDVGSAKYEAVETIQYSVPLWLGLLLYGLVSPMVEEIVFRGVLYNRMKRFYSIPCSVILTALLFGLFHANLPQFLYGTCMGILMALSYEKVQCFGAPVIFHMAANIFVFLGSFF